MANTDALKQQGARTSLSPTLKSHLAYTLLSGLVIMLMLSLVRLALLVYNSDMIGETPYSTVAEGFVNGLRFDLRVVVYISIPLLLAILSPWAMARRGVFRFWLTLASSVVMFLGLMEMDFYREFHQRLNGLVFQYIKEDPKTVMSMLWYGFPVVRYLLAWAFGTWLLSLLFKGIDRATRGDGLQRVAPWYKRVAVFMVILLVAVVAARGTLRQGPPMRWGDAFTTDSNFVNQLGLNGTLTLIDAAKSRFGEDRANIWKPVLEQNVATQSVREQLLTANDTLVDADEAAIRRDFVPPAERTLPIKNVVVILMESFAGHSVGALGSPNNITPYFDKLAKEGLLFDRFFSNGTHTHQGMFATMACFPNLPGFEYLVQAQHQQHPQAHAQHDGKRRSRAVAGDLAGSVQARQNQRKRAGGQHHAGGKAQHHVLGTRADIAQHHRQHRAQRGGAKTGQPAQYGQVQVVGMVAVHCVPEAGGQQHAHGQQAQPQAGAEPRGTGNLLAPGVQQ